MGIFVRMMDGLSAAKTEPQTIMIDAMYLKVEGLKNPLVLDFSL